MVSEVDVLLSAIPPHHEGDKEELGLPLVLLRLETENGRWTNSHSEF
jgi:hypothetical protein